MNCILFSCMFHKYLTHYFFKRNFPFSFCSFGVPEPLASMRVKTSLTHHCPLSLYYSIAPGAWKHVCWANEHIIFYHPVRPNTRFLCPQDFLWLLLAAVNHPSTTADTGGNKKLQSRRAVTSDHMHFPGCLQGGEVCPPEASSLASAHSPGPWGWRVREA